MQCVSNIVSWQDSGMTSHLRAVLDDLYCHTWFAMETIAGVAQTSRGTQAGTPIADVLFAVAIGRVFKTVRQELIDAGLASTARMPGDPSVFEGLGVNASDEVVFNEISFVDDAVFPVLAKPASLVDAVRATAEIVHVVFLRHGFAINYGPGKTEGLCMWAGPSSWRLGDGLPWRMAARSSARRVAAANSAYASFLVTSI